MRSVFAAALSQSWETPCRIALAEAGWAEVKKPSDK